MSTPAWKTALLEKKYRRDEEQRKRQEEDEWKLEAMPSWKRDLVLKKRAGVQLNSWRVTPRPAAVSKNSDQSKRTDLTGQHTTYKSNSGTSAQNNSRDKIKSEAPTQNHVHSTDETDSPSVDETDAESKGGVSEEHVASVHDNPFLKLERKRLNSGSGENLILNRKSSANNEVREVNRNTTSTSNYNANTVQPNVTSTRAGQSTNRLTTVDANKNKPDHEPEVIIIPKPKNMFIDSRERHEYDTKPMTLRTRSLSPSPANRRLTTYRDMPDSGDSSPRTPTSPTSLSPRSCDDESEESVAKGKVNRLLGMFGKPVTHDELTEFNRRARRNSLDRQTYQKPSRETVTVSSHTIKTSTSESGKPPLPPNTSTAKSKPPITPMTTVNTQHAYSAMSRPRATSPNGVSKVDLKPIEPVPSRISSTEEADENIPMPKPRKPKKQKLDASTIIRLENNAQVKRPNYATRISPTVEDDNNKGETANTVNNTDQVVMRRHPPKIQPLDVKTDDEELPKPNTVSNIRNSFSEYNGPVPIPIPVQSSTKRRAPPPPTQITSNQKQAPKPPIQPTTNEKPTPDPPTQVTSSVKEVSQPTIQMTSIEKEVPQPSVQLSSNEKEVSKSTKQLSSNGKRAPQPPMQIAIEKEEPQPIVQPTSTEKEVPQSTKQETANGKRAPQPPTQTNTYEIKPQKNNGANAVVTPNTTTTPAPVQIKTNEAIPVTATSRSKISISQPNVKTETTTSVDKQTIIMTPVTKESNVNSDSDVRQAVAELKSVGTTFRVTPRKNKNNETKKDFTTNDVKKSSTVIDSNNTSVTKKTTLTVNSVSRTTPTFTSETAKVQENNTDRKVDDDVPVSNIDDIPVSNIDDFLSPPTSPMKENIPEIKQNIVIVKDKDAETQNKVIVNSKTEPSKPVQNGDIVSNGTNVIEQPNRHEFVKPPLKRVSVGKHKKISMYRFIGENAPTGKPSMLTKSRQNQKRGIHFNDSATVKHFYPSEESLLEDDEDTIQPAPELDSDDDILSSTKSGLKSNTALSAQGLQSYTPAHLPEMYMNTVERRRHEDKKPEPEPVQPPPPQTEDFTDFKPLDDKDADYFSTSSSSTALLF